MREQVRLIKPHPTIYLADTADMLRAWDEITVETVTSITTSETVDSIIVVPSLLVGLIKKKPASLTIKMSEQSEILSPSEILQHPCITQEAIPPGETLMTLQTLMDREDESLCPPPLKTLTPRPKSPRPNLSIDVPNPPMTAPIMPHGSGRSVSPVEDSRKKTDDLLLNFVASEQRRRKLKEQRLNSRNDRKESSGNTTDWQVPLPIKNLASITPSALSAHAKPTPPDSQWARISHTVHSVGRTISQTSSRFKIKAESWAEQNPLLFRMIIVGCIVIFVPALLPILAGIVL